MDFLSFVDKTFSFLTDWAKYVVVFWFVYTGIALGAFFGGRKTPKSEVEKQNSDSAAVEKNLVEISQQPPWRMVNDYYIDNVLKELNKLEAAKGSGRIKEQSLAAALRPLFDRAAFYDYREGSWEYFLFPLCKTRLLLGHYMNSFSSYQDKEKIGRAVQIMSDLEKDAADTFQRLDLDDLLKHNMDNSDSFNSQLVDRTNYDERALQLKRIKALEKVYSLLIPIHLANPRTLYNPYSNKKQ